MTILRTEHVKKFYGKEKTPAVEDLTLEIPANTIFGYLGPNGAGKTTTIKIMTGLLRPSSGKVWLKNLEIGENNLELRRRIGYLSQDPLYYKWMTGEELLVMVGRIFGKSHKEALLKAEQLLELAGLASAKRKRIGAYSGGMVQRLGIAQALVNDPEILFLDEPVSSMDPLGRKEVLEFIYNLRDRTTVFMSTHILSDVERICDRVGILHQGKLIILKEMAKLKEEYAPPRVDLSFSNTQDADTFGSWLLAQESLKECRRENGGFSFSAEDFEESRSRILSYIGERHLSLASLQVRSATLEEVFVKLIGEKNG